MAIDRPSTVVMFPVSGSPGQDDQGLHAAGKALTGPDRRSVAVLDEARTDESSWLRLKVVEVPVRCVEASTMPTTATMTSAARITLTPAKALARCKENRVTDGLF